MLASGAEVLVEDILGVDLEAKDRVKLLVLSRLGMVMLEFLLSHLRMHKHPMLWFQVHF